MSIQVTVAEAVGRTLAYLGVGRAFGVVGSGNFNATNSLIDGGVPFVQTRHEMGAVCMADAYSRITGRVTVVSVHQGCGLTNALTGIGEAAKSRTSVFVMAGDTPSYATASNFFIHQDAVVEGVGARAWRINRAETAIVDVWRAYVMCLVERRTVVFSMPLDLQEIEIEWDVTLIPPLPTLLAPAGSPEAIGKLVDALAAAERPVIVGGRGARGAVAEVRLLAEAAGALLATSAIGRGLFQEDVWHLDVMGGFSTPATEDLIRDADLVVSFGASLNRWTTRDGSLLRGGVVQVDDTLEAIGQHSRIDFGIVGDAGAVALAAAAQLTLRGGRDGEGYRTAAVRARLGESNSWRAEPYDDLGDAAHIDPRTLTSALDDLLPSERVVTVDGGNFCPYPAMFLAVPDNEGFCLPLAFQSIGLSLASGIGAALANPDRLGVVGIGDGGFMMSHVELDTAVRLGLGLLVIVYNDDAYGAEVQHFRHETDRLETVLFPETDIAAIARGYGCEALSIRSLEDLEPVSTWLSGERNRPLVLDAKTTAFASWIMSHAIGGDG